MTSATTDTIVVDSSSDQARENTKSDITSNNKRRLNDKEKDYIFFAKAILEKVPLHGK